VALADEPETDAATTVAPQPEPGQDRYLTVPNAVTLLRLLCLPIFVWLMFGTEDYLAAAVLLAVLGATDWVDGYVARHFHQVSNFGKMFDPTVDRLLFFVGIVSIVVAGAAPLGFCLVVLAREVVVASITIVLFVRKVEPVDVTWFGKAGTFLLMCAFPLFLGGSSDVSFASALTLAGWLTGIPGVVLSYYAGFRYIPLWRERIAAARLAAPPSRGSTSAG
jgi:cardiolipin synthase (CMP-forming)